MIIVENNNNQITVVDDMLHKNNLLPKWYNKETTNIRFYENKGKPAGMYVYEDLPDYTLVTVYTELGKYVVGFGLDIQKFNIAVRNKDKHNFAEGTPEFVAAYKTREQEPNLPQFSFINFLPESLVVYLNSEFSFLMKNINDYKNYNNNIIAKENCLAYNYDGDLIFSTKADSKLQGIQIYKEMFEEEITLKPNTKNN